MILLREVWALVRDLPDAVARWCDRTETEEHQPQPVPADDVAEWPNGEMPWCLRCDVAWPCRVVLDADDRLTTRTGGAW